MVCVLYLNFLKKEKNIANSHDTGVTQKTMWDISLS